MIIYTDGSCNPNPGSGGYGVVILDNNENLKYYYYHQEENTTNNIQELKSILYALCYIKLYGNKKEEHIIYSDSIYAINALTRWAKTWANNNWTRQGNKIIQNLNLIKEGYKLLNDLSFQITLIKVKGHNNNIGNEMADALSNQNWSKFNLYLNVIKKQEI